MKRINILFIGYGILGDHIICFKSLAMLKEKYPLSEITFVGIPAFAKIGKEYGQGIIDRVLDIEDIEFGKYSKYPLQKSNYWDGIFNNVNLIINHKMDMDGYFADNMISKGFRWIRTTTEINITHSDKILLQDKVKDESRSAYAQVGELVELIGCTTNNWQTNLTIGFDIQEKKFTAIEKHFNTRTNKLIAFHPGSSTEEKSYPLANWAEVINYLLKEPDAKLLIFVGPNEEKQLNEIKVLFSEKQTMIINQPLIESIAFLSLCNLFIGHDTGFAHIAASLKISSVLLFGPASSNTWKPPAKRTNIIYSNNLKTLKPETIIKFIKNGSTYL